MNDNHALFEELDRGGHLPIHTGALETLDALDAPPRTCDFGRVRGMMLGLAVGDALGNTTEGKNPDQRRARVGREIRDYLPHPRAGGRAVGLPSDDTQMAAWTLEEALEAGGLDPGRLARRFLEERIFGIGRSVSTFRLKAREGGPWWEWAPPSAGNGALMRIAPVLVPHLRSGGPELWRDTVLSARITHADRASVSSCVAFVRVLWELLDRNEPPPTGWWIERWVEVADALEPPGRYEPRSPLGFRGRLVDLVRREVPRALEAGESVVEAGERLYSGAYLLETVPMVLLILARWGHDPEEAIVRAVNDTRDNDTVGAIVGAAVGALHGEAALPARWREGLTGRTGKDDDGRLFELLEEAEGRWG